MRGLILPVSCFQASPELSDSTAGIIDQHLPVRGARDMNLEGPHAKDRAANAVPPSLAAHRRCGARLRGTAKSTAICQQPAMPNGRCRLHGGLSTGPRTPDGLERCRRARWKHGGYSARARALTRQWRRRQRELQLQTWYWGLTIPPVRIAKVMRRMGLTPAPESAAWQDMYPGWPKGYRGASRRRGV